MSKFDYSAEAEDTAPHKKKSKSKSPKKSDHKHLIEPCVVSYQREWFLKEHVRSDERKLTIEGYCPICGKLNSLDDRSKWYKQVLRQGVAFRYYETVLTEEGEREMNPETRTLPYFEIDNPFDKNVRLQEDLY